MFETFGLDDEELTQVLPEEVQGPTERPDYYSEYNWPLYKNTDFIISEKLAARLTTTDILEITDARKYPWDIFNYLDKHTSVEVRDFNSCVVKLDGHRIPAFLHHPEDVYIDVYGNYSPIKQKVQGILNRELFGTNVVIKAAHNCGTDCVPIYIEDYDTVLMVNVFSASVRLSIVHPRNWDIDSVPHIVNAVTEYALANGLNLPAINPIEFSSVSENQEAASNHELLNVNRIKQQYTAAVSRYTELMQLHTLSKTRGTEINDNLLALKAFVDASPQFHKAVVVTQFVPEPILEIKLIRNESIIQPYNNSDMALDELEESMRERIISNEGSYEDEGFDPEESDSWISLSFGDGCAFRMEEAILSVRITYDMTLKPTNHNFNIAPLSGVGRQGYWDSDQVHPHAPSDGDPCLGDFAVPLADAISKADFISVFTMMDIFCNTYNQHDDAGHLVVNWDQADASDLS